MSSNEHWTTVVKYGGWRMLRARFVGSSDYHVALLRYRFVESLRRCPIAQAFDEPLVVVGLDEGSDSLAEIVRILEQPDQRYCSLTVRMSDRPPRLSGEGGIVFDAQPVEGPLEVVGGYWLPRSWRSLGDPFGQQLSHHVAATARRNCLVNRTNA
jgi:hypothetical protein